MYTDLESPEHQEWRSRQQVSWPAILKTGLGLGLFLFIFSGGTPWTSGGIANSMMGRAMPWPWIVTTMAHFALAIGYMAVIAHVIYRFKVIPGILLGVAVSAILYGINFAFFAMQGALNDRGDARALGAHLVLGLFGSAIYKALSVPPPYRIGEGEGESHTAASSAR